jgi:hypothetical protein
VSQERFTWLTNQRIAIEGRDGDLTVCIRRFPWLPWETLVHSIEDPVADWQEAFYRLLLEYVKLEEFLVEDEE